MALALTSAAQAGYINGTIGFVGSATLNNSNIALATAVNSWSGAAAGGLPGAGAPITGDFIGILVGAPVTFGSPWTFSSPKVGLWAVNGFTFDIGSSLVSVGVLGGQTFLNVSGTGLIKKAGFTDTPGVFSFTAQTPGVASVFTFSASGNAVPDGGATVALLGLSILGLGGVGRLVRRK